MFDLVQNAPLIATELFFAKKNAAEAIPKKVNFRSVKYRR